MSNFIYEQDVLLFLLLCNPSQNKIGAGRLMGPKGVAVDKNGHIITVDNKACCVFIFQSNGKLVTKFGGRGTSDRQFAGEEVALLCRSEALVLTRQVSLFYD